MPKRLSQKTTQNRIYELAELSVLWKRRLEFNPGSTQTYCKVYPNLLDKALEYLIKKLRRLKQMKESTIEQIVNGTKKTVNIEGYIYDIHFEEDGSICCLIGRSRKNQSEVYNCDRDAYAYTHGGRIYRLAVEALWDIQSALTIYMGKSSL